jgi:hypothetical protein
LKQQILLHAKAEADKYKKDLQKKSQDAREGECAREWPDMEPIIKASLYDVKTATIPYSSAPPAQTTNPPQFMVPPPGMS